jgi:hypothetical protein
MVEIRVENTLSNIIRTAAIYAKQGDVISPLFHHGRLYGDGG